jgi:hypothetical protein
MRRMQGTSKKTTIVGFGLLPMRMGVAECRSGVRRAYRISRANTKACSE